MSTSAAPSVTEPLAENRGIDWGIFRRFGFIAATFWTGPRAWVPWLWLIVTISAIAVGARLTGYQSYVQRDILDHLAARQQDAFWHSLILSGLTFISIQGAQLVEVWLYQRLALEWRKSLTSETLGLYLANRSYYRMRGSTHPDNPDERITEDIALTTTYSTIILVAIAQSVSQFVVFLPILWSTAHWLVVFLLPYALVGSIIFSWLFGSLAKFDAIQLKAEADFRYGLVRLRDNAESIAFYGGEHSEHSELLRRFGVVCANAVRVIGRNVRVSTGNALFVAGTSVVPLAIIAPEYFAHHVDIGTTQQVTNATSALLRASSFAMTYFTTITLFTAQVNRLYDLRKRLLSDAETPTHIEEAPSLELNAVTVCTPGETSRILVKDLSLSLPPATSMIINGSSGVGKSSLLRVIAGLWRPEAGFVRRPQSERIMFLPQRPYMPLGTLRTQLTYPSPPDRFSTDTIEQALKLVNFAERVRHIGDLDTELDWASVLSLGEQQRIAFVRLLLNRPNLAILDEATSALDLASEEHLYTLLQDVPELTFVSVGHRESLLGKHDLVLNLQGNGMWSTMPTAEVVNIS